MSTQFTIDLTINMPDGGRHTRNLLNFYFTDMPADINETAQKYHDAGEAGAAQKFANLNLKRAEVWPSPEGGLKIFVLLSVFADDSASISQVISKYIEVFPDYLEAAWKRYLPRTSFPPDINLKPADWSAEVHAAK